jgi:hypothetical protein
MGLTNPIRNLEERIKRGYEAIGRAKSEGHDTSKWEKHLVELETQLIEEILGIKLSEFTTRHLGLQIYSEVLGLEIWFCSNETIASQIKHDDPEAVTYTVDEMRELIRLQPTPEELKRLHDARSVFDGSRIIKSTSIPEVLK